VIVTLLTIFNQYYQFLTVVLPIKHFGSLNTFQAKFLSY